jgi:hypothetical protein
VVLDNITLNAFPVNIVNNISQEKLFSILLKRPDISWELEFQKFTNG